MAHSQKPDFVFRRNGRVHLNQRGRHFSRLLAAEVCASAVIMLDTPCSEVVWRVLATHSIHPPVRHRVPSHFNWTLTPTDALFYNLSSQFFYMATTCFGTIISPSSGSWHRSVFKTYSNKVGKSALIIEPHCCISCQYLLLDVVGGRREWHF